MTYNSNGKKIANLAEIAHQAMIDRGFDPDFSDKVMQELSAMEGPSQPPHLSSMRDMRDRPWLSIDNDDSRDLDQITYAEKGPSGKYKLYVAVADVDALVKRRSAIDHHAAHNTTSVYTPARIFPMLPNKLSTNLTSLNENEDRCAIVIELEVASDGQFDLSSIYSAWVRNHAKLAYNGVAAWLDQKGDAPPLINTAAGIAEQLKLQDFLSELIKNYRNRQGALHFGTIELLPIMVDNLAVDLKEKVENRAHHLIENCMIAANVAASRYLEHKGLPVFRRIVRTPKRWERIVDLARDRGEKLPDQPNAKALRQFLLKQHRSDPATFPDLSLAMIKLIGRGEYVVGMPGDTSPGHFDLALVDYAHTTAPNRRFPDLIMQRLLKSCLYLQPIPYDSTELVHLASHCTQKEDDATKVERRLHKSAIAMVLANRIGEEFKGMVTGASENGTWVRLLSPPVEGRLVKGTYGLDVGDYLAVKLVHVDVFNGYIDFVKT